MTPTKTFEIRRHRSSGGVRTGCLHTIDVMEMSIFNYRHGVVPRRQVGTVPGYNGQPQLLAPLSPDREEAGMGQSTATSFNLQMLHWNAEGVRNKNTRTPSSSEGKKHRCLLYTGDTPKLKSPLLY